MDAAFEREWMAMLANGVTNKDDMHAKWVDVLSCM
jgi:hypothetical protein